MAKPASYMEAENVIQKKNQMKFGLTRDQVAPQFREPYILTGYRRPYINAKDCLHSAFLPRCNEAFNVWSHFVAFLAFVVKFWYNFSGDHSLNNIFTWPEFSFAIGICGFCLMSATAHVFNSISTNVRQMCFYMDYAAISIYSVGAGQAFYFYSRPLNTELPVLNSTERFMLASLISSICSTVICCMSRNRWKRMKYVTRTVAYVLPFVVNCYPYMYRACLSTSSTDLISESFPTFKQHLYLYIFSALANATRFPECIFPGKFDLIGASHHYLHVFTGVGAAYQFDAIHIDMLQRKHDLLKATSQPSFENTIYPMLVAIIVNIGIALWFSLAYNSKCSKKN